MNLCLFILKRPRQDELHKQKPNSNEKDEEGLTFPKRMHFTK